MRSDSKIYVAGHSGLVGSALIRRLKQEGYTNIVTRSHAQLDLTDQRQTEQFFAHEKPEYVLIAAAKVGGIKANMDNPADFLFQNLAIQQNVIKASVDNDVKKLLFLGSSCIYPKDCVQPMREEHLLTGPLEPSNEAYAIAKIAGIKLCEAMQAQYGLEHIAVMPPNLYGPNDNFDPGTSHVLPALIRRMHDAKLTNDSVFTVWGTGTPLREFMHSDDLATICIALMNTTTRGIINTGSGEEISIRQLAELIKQEIGFKGSLEYDESRPDGHPRKMLDSSLMNSLGLRTTIGLSEGIAKTYREFLDYQNRVS